MPSRTPKSRSNRPAQSRAAAPGSPDFNDMWRSKDLGQLTGIPLNLQGWCGCSICGSKKLVKGSVFRQHMWTLHSSLPNQPGPSKRSRTSSLPTKGQPSPDPSLFRSPATPISATPLPTIVEPMDLDPSPLNFDEPDQDGGYDADGEGLMGGGDTDTEAEGALADTELADEADGLEDLAQLLAGSSLMDIEPQPTPPPTPSPTPSDITPSPSHIDTTSTVYGRDLSTLQEDDLLSIWPYPLPAYLLPPPSSGSLPNPFASSPDANQHLPLASKILPLLAHTLAGLANIPRRSIELVLQTAALLVAHTRQSMYERFRKWYIDTHPDAHTQLESLDENFAPGLGDPSAAPKTAATAFKQLKVDDNLIVHPICKNHDCNHVFLDHTSQKSFPSLPPLCPTCSEPLFNTKGSVDVLHFPRRSLQSELEVLFRVPGVETAIEKRRARKQHRDHADSTRNATSKIYRQQDDGSAWSSDRDNDDMLSVTVNLSIDWANPSSSRSASSSSMGPFCLQVADLPPQLRAAFCCMMIMGITPAPKAPKAANLWKLLLPLSLELRDAGLHGVWVRTPKFPEGRRIRVHLACLCCDRPAAVELTGGPHFKAKEAPCLRCLVTYDDLLRLERSALRSSRDHSQAVLEQVTAVPLATRQDRERWESEPPFDPITGARKSRTYTKARRDAVIKATTRVRGNVSALALIPGLDLFGSSVFDPMHSILEGCNKTYFYKVLQLGEHGMVEGLSGASTDAGREGTSDEEPPRFNEARLILEEMRAGGVPNARPPAVIEALQRDLSGMSRTTRSARKARMTPGDISYMQARLAATQTPSSIHKLHSSFGTAAAGSPTAHDWRVFSTVYAPLFLPVMHAQRGPRDGRVGNAIFTKDELYAQLLLCEITSLALRPTISELQVERLEALILVWQRLVYALHPSLRNSTNIHVISHLASDIRSFGPAYGWWCFPGERLNYIVKNTNRSGGSHYQAQVVAMRAVVRSREVVSTRSRNLIVSEGAPDSERALADDVGALLDGFSIQSAASTLEQVAYMYAEVDKRDLESVGDHSTERVVTNRRGAIREGTLDRGTLRKLQDCLKLHGIDTSTTATSGSTYITSQVKFWEGIVINGRRLDCADWTNRLTTSSEPSSLDSLITSRNSIFEARPEDNRWKLLDQNSRSGVMCAIFEHKIGVGGLDEGIPGLYGIVRLFKPHIGPDVYGYRQHPSLDVWTWEHHCLQEPFVIALRPEVLAAVRSLALVSLPLDPHDDSKGSIWATIPVHQQ